MKKITALILAVLMALTVVSALADSPLYTFQVTEINRGGMVMGRCTAPTGWQVTGNAYVGTTGQSMENPWMLNIIATDNVSGTMAYCSERNFLQILRWDGGTPHQEGVYNATFHTPMLSYRNAAGFCDYTASQFALDGASLTLVEDNQYPAAQSLFREKEKILLQKGNELASASNMSVDAVECSACFRRYSLDFQGVPSYVCVFAGVEGIQSTGRVAGIYTDAVISTVSWGVPFTYIMICPVANWNTYEPVFTQFIENTAASDEFKAANDRLAKELMDIVTGKPDMSSGISYSERVMGEETSSGDSYSSDRFSDYLFDQNDYTLSDGSHVKVSTAYDYVYEGNNGTVFYTDSAFLQPGGSTQLYANR